MSLLFPSLWQTFMRLLQVLDLQKSLKAAQFFRLTRKFALQLLLAHRLGSTMVMHDPIVCMSLMLVNSLVLLRHKDCAWLGFPMNWGFHDRGWSVRLNC